MGPRPDHDLRAIAPTISRILNVPSPEGAEVQPMEAVLDTLPSAERLAFIAIDAFGSSLWRFVGDSVPTLNHLAAGHRVDLSSVLPSVTYVCITTIISGMAPEAHGVTDLDGMIRRAPEVDTLFHAVRRAGGETMIGVHRKAVEGLPVERMVDHAVIVEGIYDDELYSRCIDVIGESTPDLAFLHLTDIDEVGHVYGPYTEAVREAAVQLDDRLRGLLVILGRLGYAVLVGADHGLHGAPEGRSNDNGQLGTHDGSVEEDLLVPLIWASSMDLIRLAAVD